MGYSFPEIKSFKGLCLQANSFSLPDGALEEAENVVIAKDGIVSKMRGSYLYLSGGGKTLRRRFMYQGTQFAAYADQISSLADTGSLPNKTGVASVLPGETVAISSTPRTMEQNQNVYITTDLGVMKLETTAGPVMKTGVPPALDLRGFITYTAGGIAGNAEHSWRVVFGRRDAQNQLYLGSPSDILVLTNPLVSATWTKAGGGPYTVTVTTGDPHKLSTGMSVTVQNATGTGMDGDHPITVASPTTFTWSQATDPGTPGTLNLEYYLSLSARLEFSLPSEIDSTTPAWFYQVYRSSPSNDATSLPLPDYKLIDEQPISQAEIDAGVVIYNDLTSDIFRGAELYTNEGSREGEAQANARPPLCQDISLFKNYAVYANCTSRHNLAFNLVSVDAAYINADDYVEVKLGAVTRRYVARGGVGNDIVPATATGTGTITVTYTAHGLKNGDYVYVTSVTGTLSAGAYQVSNRTANTFDITAPGKTATALDFEGLTDSSGYFMFQLYTGGTVSVNLRETASGLVKAMNSDSDCPVYAKYISGPTDIPGQMRLEAKGFGGSFSLRAVSATSAPVGQAFSPDLPASFLSGAQVTSSNDSLPHAIYVSKVGEPEAVPTVNYFPVGSKNKAILRAVALRDSLLILKEDGVWVVNGDSISNLFATPLDTTAICLAPNSVDLINNQVVMLSNQGVCLCSATAVRVISRDIETPIKAVLGSAALAAETSGAAYESERLYFLTTLLPGATSANVTWVYNTLSDGWSTCDYLILEGGVGPGDVFFWVERDNTIRRERKSFDRTDFCGQNYAVTVNSVASDSLSADIAVSTPPVAGDILIKSGVISRIVSSASSGPGTYAVTFKAKSNIAGGGTVTLYQSTVAKVKLAPVHAGEVGRMKQFAAMQMHLRDNSVSDVAISFTTNQFGGSAEVDWDSSALFGAQGWGAAPWGFFAWGQEDGISSKYATQPAPPVRVLIPIEAQRATFIQPYLVHSNAGEEINLQSISFAVRGYQERTTR